MGIANHISMKEKMYSAPLVIEDTKDSAFLKGLKIEADMKSLVICPISSRKKKFGMLLVSRKEAEQGFSEIDTRNISIFVTQMAQSIVNTKLFEQLEVKVSELENVNNQLEELTQELGKNKGRIGNISEVLECIEEILGRKDITPETREQINKIKDKILKMK
jgi:transcriptional regulator with GAF, ATPase, and Fis domain